MRSRTTLNLDMDLVHEAGETLGSTQVTETIHRALWEVVSRKRRAQALAYDFSDLPLDDIRGQEATVLSDDLQSV